MANPKKIIMTESDLKLYRESIIRECKLKYNYKREPISVTKFFRLMKRFLPLTIIVGVAAATIYVSLNGWQMFFQQILTGIIWITLISAFISTINKTKN